MTNKGLTWTQVKPLLQKGYWAIYSVWLPHFNYRCRIRNDDLQLKADHMLEWKSPLPLDDSEYHLPNWHIIIPTDGTTPEGLTWDEIKPALEDGMFARFSPWHPGYSLRLRNGVQELKSPSQKGTWQPFICAFTDYDTEPNWSIIPDPDAEEKPQNLLKEENERLKEEIETLKIYLKNANESNHILDKALLKYKDTINSIKAFVDNA